MDLKITSTRCSCCFMKSFVKIPPTSVKNRTLPWPNSPFLKNFVLHCYEEITQQNSNNTLYDHRPPYKALSWRAKMKMSVLKSFENDKHLLNWMKSSPDWVKEQPWIKCGASLAQTTMSPLCVLFLCSLVSVHSKPKNTASFGCIADEFSNICELESLRDPLT